MCGSFVFILYKYYIIVEQRSNFNMKATKIKMKSGCENSNNLLEIDSIYLTGLSEEGFYKKEAIYDYLVKNPNTIQVNIYPYPNLIKAVSSRQEKYVRSTPNDSTKDNLLNLTRE